MNNFEKKLQQTKQAKIIKNKVKKKLFLDILNNKREKP